MKKNTRSNSKKQAKLDSFATTKLALKNTLVGILFATILYDFLPFILNYPDNTINNDFQVQMVGIKYTDQYIVMMTILAVIVFLSFQIAYRKISLANVKTKKDVETLRKRCFNYPYFTIMIEIALPTILCALLLAIFNTNTELLLRLTIVIFSFTSVYAITSYMLNKKFFENILVATSNMTDKPITGFHYNIYQKLITLIFPLFLYSTVLILLITISVMTTEKGNLLYSLYQQELRNSFQENTVYDLENAKSKLEKLNLKSEKDHIVMFSAKDGKVYFANGDINNFLVQYTLKYYQESNGQCFEYYGQNTQASIIKITTTQGDYYVGIRFFVFNSNIFIPFLIIAVITIIFNVFYIYYIGRGLSDDLNKVSGSLLKISSQKNMMLANNLPITSNDEIGDLTVEYNRIQNITKQHVQQIQDNQSMLMERERLASLGQMIGGISHNLKTPIMSISGAAEGLSDLITEFDKSIGDPDITNDDFHSIASDMNEWITKIHSYTGYMSDIITAVKGQAVTLSENEQETFTIDELVKRVKILMKNELQNGHAVLNINLNSLENSTIHGNVNSLVQVVNNLVTNAIQSYRGEPDGIVELSTTKSNNEIFITVEDHGCGMPQDVQDKLFREMITTKGKNGTGLGMFMSYSTIKGKFKGNMAFETKERKGTKFTITLPIN